MKDGEGTAGLQGDERRSTVMRNDESGNSDCVCPVCGAELVQEKCKVVCRSECCVYRLIFNCSEF